MKTRTIYAISTVSWVFIGMFLLSMVGCAICVQTPVDVEVEKEIKNDNG